MSQKHVKGTIASSAAIVAISLVQGEAYGLIVGSESAGNFNSQTITPKLSDGVNTGDEAQATLTVDTQVTAGDTMTIGDRIYTFVAADAVRTKADSRNAEINLGADLAGTQENILAAINGTGDKDQADPLVTAGAWAADASVIEARDGGTAGNAIASAETFTAGSNVFDAGTLGTTQAGTDSYDNVISIPQIGSADSTGSPQAFAASGIIGFDAILPQLLLVPSGSITDVDYYLTRLEAQRNHR